MKDFWQLRVELDEARARRQMGLPTWAKGAAMGLLTKVRTSGASIMSNDDPKVRDKMLSRQITYAAALSALGMSVNSKDKTLVTKARSLSRKR